MLVKYVALLMGLLVVVAFAVRPAIRHAGAALAARGPARTAGRELAAAEGIAGQVKPSRSAPPSIRNGCGTQEIFEQVTTHLKREPTQSSRLLQSWIHSE